MFTRLLPFRFQAGELFLFGFVQIWNPSCSQKATPRALLLFYVDYCLTSNIYIYNLSVKQRKQKKII